MTQRKPLVTSIHLEEVIHKSSGVSESLSWSAFSSNMTKEIWQNMEWYYMLIGWWQSHSKAQSSFFFYWLSQQTARHGLPGRSHHSMSQESVTFTKTINRATTEMATQKTSLWSVSWRATCCFIESRVAPCWPLERIQMCKKREYNFLIVKTGPAANSFTTFSHVCLYIELCD